MAPSKSQALTKITRTSLAANRAAVKAEETLEARDRAIMDARHATVPASYQEIADAAGITKDRVSQIIQVQRAREKAEDGKRAATA